LTTAVIIQARMGSKRLPGKVMMDIHGKPMLQHVIERCQKIKNADKVIVVFPAEQSSKALYEVAMTCGAYWLYGSEDNVLSRYYDAAVREDAEVIVRVTADCPLIDPSVCDRVIALRRGENAEYASNCHPRSFPKGLDCEVFTFRALKDAWTKATDPYDLEHVTPYIIRNNPRVNLASGQFGVGDINWSVDTLEDLERVRSIYAAMEQLEQIA
jgi:spore coat polysaccharide biosynthesis protein SpsF